MRHEKGSLEVYGEVISVFEVFVCLATLPMSVVIFVIVYRTAIMHKNLKFIVLCESVAIFWRAIFGLGIVVENFIEGNSVFDMPIAMTICFGFFLTMRNVCGHVLLLERIYATIRVKTYEKENSPLFSIVWFIIAILLSLFGVASSALVSKGLNIPGSAIMFYTVLNYTALFALGLIEIPLFTCLLRYNHSKYKNAILYRNFQNMSERYQLSENIRTGRQFLPVICIQFMSVTNTTVIFAFEYFGAFGSDIYNTMMLKIQIFVASLLSLLIEASVIMFHPILYRKVESWLKPWFYTFESRFWSFLNRCMNGPTQTRAVSTAVVRPTIGVVSQSVICGGGEAERRLGGGPRTERRKSCVEQIRPGDLGAGGGTAGSSAKALLTTIDGEALKTHSTADEHFEMLRKMWN